MFDKVKTKLGWSERGFYWVYFAVFTTISVGVNAWHGGIKAPLHFAALKESLPTLWKAWKVTADMPPTWFTLGAVFLAALMPIALAFGSHALANPNPSIGTARTWINYTLTGATVAGAFILSFLAMQDMGVMLLGLSPVAAAILPIAVDIAIVSSLFGLMAHSPKVQDDAVAQRVEQAVGRLEASREADVNRIMAQLTGHLEATREADREAILEQLTGHFTGQLDATRGAILEQIAARPTIHEAHQRPVTQRPAPRAKSFILTREPAEVAADLAENGSFDQSVEVIEQVLSLAADGLSHRKIADAVTADTISSSTVGRILNAAKDLDGEPTLAAVG
ncbi:Protein of uncharacterised function (DUF2637) [Mycobacteroides abscessus subsp. abscessus]|uniref:hypothetical protein n=1 Tax=Mycobacteroides abscessus TaxID=36809 RepID=UPI000927254A|nr:hypothetical protein [Mycobacteroides abscessus]MDM2175304.1 hypothetical protein [Mycobacteroides abscessus]MDM2176310.1 hypothetical protein [Mycobacteroides abscessus]MDM2204875.1 hypothetical protein [Mycobacteroides abscessus]MDM2210460.1 hypothetical protein [Mycobacteroides abscessus]MDM2215794.1 hypothetical protein [Mycobacteroides abscessus]